MKLLSFLQVGLLFLFLGCGGGTMQVYDFNKGGSSTETIGVEWKGALDDAPTKPDTNWTYFNNNDNVAYIWSGNNWDTLTVTNSASLDNLEALDSIPLVWKGVRSTAPVEPKVDWAYYDRQLHSSFIWDSTAWSVLIKDSEFNDPIIWKGILKTAPLQPLKNWAYYNSVMGKSYIFNGQDWTYLDKETITDIEPLDTIQWMGELAASPLQPMINWVYLNSTDSNTYIFTGMFWDILAYASYENSYNRLEGISITWLSTLGEPPSNPTTGAAYFDKALGSTFIWNKREWAVLSPTSSIGDYRWIGILLKAPENPVKNQCYFHAKNGASYIYNGTVWNIFSRADIEAEI